MKKQGFTLIELLVVISIISVLMAVLMPALQLVKKKASTSVCLSNMKNLSMGWYMYMQENDGRIMSADDDGTEPGGRYIGWIGVPRDAAGNLCDNFQTDPEVTDEDEIRGIEAGVLYPYIKDPKAYHCPANNRVVSIYDGSKIYVGYSMPACLNGSPANSAAEQIKIYSQISRPSTRYAFVENTEARNWTQKHHFEMGAPEYTGQRKWGWWSPMSINHGDSSVLGFCDGHSEAHKWQDPFTIERVDKLSTAGGTLYGVEYPPDGQENDIAYMAEGWPFRYNMRGG